MILLIALPVWNARADLIPAITNGYPLFVRRDHIYPVFAPDKAINDANKILAHVEENAIVFAPWDKLYSYVYTAHIEEWEDRHFFSRGMEHRGRKVGKLCHCIY